MTCYRSELVMCSPVKVGKRDIRGVKLWFKYCNYFHSQLCLSPAIDRRGHIM